MLIHTRLHKMKIFQMNINTSKWSNYMIWFMIVFIYGHLTILPEKSYWMKCLPFLLEPMMMSRYLRLLLFIIHVYLTHPWKVIHLYSVSTINALRKTLFVPSGQTQSVEIADSSSIKKERLMKNL